MMKLIVLLCICTMAYTYTDIGDDFDIEGLINNTTELKAHLYCYLDKGPCTDFMKLGKSHTVEAVSDACAECDTVQKHDYRLFLKAIRDKFPEDYELYKIKYDSHGDHFAALEKELAKY